MPGSGDGEPTVAVDRRDGNIVHVTAPVGVPSAVNPIATGNGSGGVDYWRSTDGTHFAYQNISLPNLRAYAPGMLVAVAAERQNAERQKKSLGIRVPDVGTAAGVLSGGNQQKVVLAKWLSLDPKLLIFDEPTRGIDVGAKAEIYDLMHRLAAQGVGVLMISSDMEEILGVSDRVAVMHEGRLTGVLEREDCSEEAIMRLAVGHANMGEQVSTSRGSERV